MRTIGRHIKQMSEPGASRLLLLLISMDLVFFVIYFIDRFYPLGPRPSLFRLDLDRTYPEFFQYTKFVWIVILLIYLMISRKRVHYISWILVVTYLLVDDSFMIRERMGWYFTNNVEIIPPFNLRLQDMGEMFAVILIGPLLLATLVWAHVRGSPGFRKVSLDLFIIVAGLAFFAVFFDVVHSMFTLGRTADIFAAFLEDGGEMLVTSLLLWYVFLASLWTGEPKNYLHEGFRRPRAAVSPGNSSEG